MKKVHFGVAFWGHRAYFWLTLGQVSRKMGYATKEDFQACHELHRRFGTTYFLASRAFKEPIRSYTDAVYGFVREVDEWVDNPGGMPVEEIRSKIADYRAQIEAAFEKQTCPTTPILRAFTDVCAETGIPLEEPLSFLDAMEMDLTTQTYPTFEELSRYMRGAAAAVALMMCWVSGTSPTPEMKEYAITLAYAMQMTNFLRDIPEDARRGRIYLPLEDLSRFQVTEKEVQTGEFSDRFRYLIEFETARTRELYQVGEKGIPLLPRKTQKAVTLASALYSQILGQLEAQESNPYLGRARTTRAQKAGAIWRYWVCGKTLQR